MSNVLTYAALAMLAIAMLTGVEWLDHPNVEILIAGLLIAGAIYAKKEQ